MPLDLSILETCETLHADFIGISDPLHKAESRRYLQYLSFKLETWKPSSLPFTRAYDEAVYSLMEKTLLEYAKRSLR